MIHKRHPWTVEDTELIEVNSDASDSTEIKPKKPPAMYHVCHGCSASGALLKCPCNSVYYCNFDCQQAHFVKHKNSCTDYLLKEIVQKSAALDQMETEVQGSNGIESVEQMSLEHDLAQVHFKVH